VSVHPASAVAGAASRREPRSDRLPERPPISAPGRRARLGRQPGLGLAGLLLVIPVALLLGVAVEGPEKSLTVLGPLSTFALPVIAIIAFWWEDWPGTVLRRAWSGWADTVLVILGGVILTIAGQLVLGHVDLEGVFNPTAGPEHAPTFPATMPLAAAIFVAMLELTLVSEGWPLRRLNRLPAGLAAGAAAWVVGLVVYFGLVDFKPAPGTGFHAQHGPVPVGDLLAALVCIGGLQVVFFVVMHGWPFSAIPSRAVRLLSANGAVIGGGLGAYLLLAHAAEMEPLTIGAVAGSVVAAGLLVGMLFEGLLTSRLVAVGSMAVVAAALYLLLKAYADSVGWTEAKPLEWVSYAGLNAIGASVILHVAVGRRWPFGTAGV
jgi:hypothetical protein